MNIGDQSFIPSYTFIDPPQAIIDPLSPSLNNIIDNPMASHFGSTCMQSAISYECSNNSDNPLFNCSANNNNFLWMGCQFTEKTYFNNNIFYKSISVNESTNHILNINFK